MDLLVNVVPALLIVVGAPLVLWWWTRRHRAGDAHRLRITDKAALGRNAWVAILEVDDKRLLLGAGESGVALVTELESLPQPLEDDPTGFGTTDPLRPGTGQDRRPWMGLYRRLQQMTLRTTAQQTLPRPYDAPPR